MSVDNTYTFTALTGKSGNNLNIRYSSDKTNWHDIFQTGDLYMQTSNDGGNVWSGAMRIVGENGNTGVGIAKIEEYYATSTNTTKPATTKFSKTIPTLSATNKYLWNYTLITYDDSPTHTEGGYNDAVIIGAYGDSVSVSKTEIRYAVSSSGTTPPETNWNETIPAVQDKQYLWTRTYVEYTDKKTTTTYSVSYKSSDGNNGKLYSLKPSVTVIKIDKSGAYSVSTITCQKILTNGDTTSVTTDGTLKMSIDGGNEQDYASITLSTTKPTKTITYNLRNSSNVLISSYTVPVYAETLTTEVQEIVGDEIQNQLPDAVQEEVENQLPDSVAIYTPKYLGEYPSLDNVPARNKKDYVLVKDGTEHKVYKWDGTSWGAVEYSTENRYMFEGCASDCLKYAEESGEIARFAVGYITNIFSNYIRIDGAVYGGKYNKNGDIDLQSTKDKGFYLGADGNFKCVNGQFEGKIQSALFRDISSDFVKIDTIKYYAAAGYSGGGVERTQEAESIEEIDLSTLGPYYRSLRYSFVLYSNNEKIFAPDAEFQTKYYLSNTEDNITEDNLINYPYDTGMNFPYYNYIWLYSRYDDVSKSEKFIKCTFLLPTGYCLSPDGSVKFFGDVELGSNSIFKGDIITDVMQMSSRDVLEWAVNMKADDDLLQSFLGEYFNSKETVTYTGKGKYGAYEFDRIRLDFYHLRNSDFCTISLYLNGPLIYTEQQEVSYMGWRGFILKWDFTFEIYQKNTKTLKLFNLPIDKAEDKGTVYIEKSTGNLKVVL